MLREGYDFCREQPHWPALVVFFVSAVSPSAGTTETQRRWALGTWNLFLTTVGRSHSRRTQQEHLWCCCWCCLFNAAQGVPEPTFLYLYHDVATRIGFKHSAAFYHDFSINDWVELCVLRTKPPTATGSTGASPSWVTCLPQCHMCNPIIKVPDPTFRLHSTS